MIKDKKQLDEFVMSLLDAPNAGARVKQNGQLNNLMNRARAINRQALNRRITERR